MRVGDVLAQAGRPVPYHVGIARALGSIPAALMLTQLLYWSDKGTEDGWIWKLEKDWDDELALSADQMKSGRLILVSLGLIEHKRSGVPAKPYYRVDLDRLEEWWESMFPPDLTVEKPRTGPGNPHGQGGGISPDIPLGDIDDFIDDPPKTKKRGQGRARPAKRVPFPDAFHLTEDMRAWAARSVPELDIGFHTRQFADHHRAKGNTMVRWDLAWQTWMRNARQWHRSAPTTGRKPSSTFQSVSE